MIQIRRLTKSFGELSVFNGLNLNIEDGKTTCLMGISGRGKTTLTRILLGLEKPDFGEITGLPAKRSALFQDDRLCETLTASKNIRLACPNISAKEAKSALSELGMGEFYSAAAGALSGGQRRRLCLARACLADADLVVLDEPFNGLDEASKALAVNFIRKRLSGKTVLLITHREEDARLFDADLTRI